MSESLLSTAPPAKAGCSARLFVITTILMVLAGGLGYALGVSRAKAQYQTGFEAGFAEAKVKVEASGLFGRGGQKVQSLSGQVTRVEADSIVLKVPQTVRNPLDEPAPLERTVKVTPETRILFMIRKSIEETRAMMEAFRAAREAYSKSVGEGNPMPPPRPPMPQEEREGKLSEIEAGAHLEVRATEDILRAASFPAVEIRMMSGQRAPALPVPMPEGERKSSDQNN